MPRERWVEVGGAQARVLEEGDGAPIAFLAGFGGLPRWSELAAELARHRRVIAPSLPGFPGAEGHDRLDDLADWVIATLDLLDAAGATGADLVGVSLGAMLAAEVAAFSRGAVRRLVLVSPLGLFDAAEPTRDVFACSPDQLPALLCADPARFVAHTAPPEGADVAEWMIIQARAAQAAARLLWPLGDRGLAKRLHRITAPTLIVTGSADRILPASYARRIAAGIHGPTEMRAIEGAGHLVDLDAPAALAAAVADFLSR
jgi:pimeloyl-ACP methyl ester carboxylesterase